MMDSGSLGRRKRSCHGAVFHLHQEAQEPAGWKRMCREVEKEGEEMKRRRRGCKENRDPGENLQGRRRDQRGVHQIRSRTTAGPGAEQSCRPEVKVALIRKTRIQTSDLILPTDFQQKKEVLDRWSRTHSKVRSRIPEAKTRRKRRKIHPSAFRGRGQLWLSITAEAGQLVIHIHEARGLMGKSHRSCDSYVKMTLTSDLHHSIRLKTQTVLNNKNPKYDRRFTLCVGDELLLKRLLVSVFRRPAESRCSQLIGCMSFGIASLISSSEVLNGWFYLLGEEYGRSKHLRVTSQRSRPMRSSEEEKMARKAVMGADLRRTPDSAPDSDLNHVIDDSSTSTATASLTNITTTTSTTGLKDLTSTLEPTNSIYSSIVSTLHTYTKQHHANLDGGGTQQMTVSIARGNDGFGFTICSDCPVKIQAVDPGGPAHQSGLRQGDSILQLNGLPVETWKCVDLAHAIRSCPSQIVLVVWRGLSEVRSGCESMPRPHAHNTNTGRKLLSYPAHSKHGHRWGQRSGIRSSFGALGSLWRDRKEDQEEEDEENEEEDQEVYASPTATLKGTRVTSSNGDNYIILSPVNSGEQLLQPVYHNRNQTIGCLYQTHSSRGQNLLHQHQLGSLQRPVTSHTSTLSPPPSSSSSSSSALPRNYGNYQNCTIVQSHVPCSGYGTYVTLAPKTVIFPVFVQPVDLCSVERSLLMSEQMILHQADLLPIKVTVLIYSDLILLTREDECGRCNVLQSPVYLKALQLREVLSEPLHLYLLQSSHRCFSLEAFSVEQKVRVCLCLQDHIQLQHRHQLPDLPSDFGLLSLGESDLLYHPSSPYSSLCDPLKPPSPSPYSPSAPFSSSTPPPFSTLSPYTTSFSPPPRTITSPAQLFLPPPHPSSTLRSPIWKDRAEEEEERRKRQREEEEVEERQQGEGESASETSENVGVVGGRDFHLGSYYFNVKQEKEEDSDDEEEFSSTYRPAVLRRSLSEGSLLQEPRSPRFLSDSTIHRLTRPVTFDLKPSSSPASRAPSPNTLRKQLTREGGSLHQMMLLLNGTKGGESRNHQLKKKNQNLAADVRGRLAFLQRWKNSTRARVNSLEKVLRNNRPSAGEVLKWAENLETLLSSQYGQTVFRHFLRSEFSEENLDFWLAVERFKRTRPSSKMPARATKIYEQFISTSAARQVNVDSAVREATNQSLRLGVSSTSFQLAQQQIFSLMETDSYPRFLKSRLYAQLANYNMQIVRESVSQ